MGDFMSVLNLCILVCLYACMYVCMYVCTYARMYICNIRNIGKSDLPDVYAQGLRATGPRAEGIHIRENHKCICYY